MSLKVQIQFNCNAVNNAMDFIFKFFREVDREMKRYNVDEFYGIELVEQHIKPRSEEEDLAHLPFALTSNRVPSPLFNACSR